MTIEQHPDDHMLARAKDVTEADRRAARYVGHLTEERGLIVAEAFAAHREAAYRAGLEAGAKVADEHGDAWGLSYRSMTDAIATAIRALATPTMLDPAGS